MLDIVSTADIFPKRESWLMARIAIGGFQHETNTFSPHPADLEAFRTVSAYPRMPRGQALVDELCDLNIGIGGFISSA